MYLILFIISLECMIFGQFCQGEHRGALDKGKYRLF